MMTNIFENKKISYTFDKKAAYNYFFQDFKWITFVTYIVDRISIDIVDRFIEDRFIQITYRLIKQTILHLEHYVLYCEM